MFNCTKFNLVNLQRKTSKITFRKVFKYKMAVGELLELTCYFGIVLLPACDLLGCRNCVSFSFMPVYAMGRAYFSESVLGSSFDFSCHIQTLRHWEFFSALSFNFLI